MSLDLYNFYLEPEKLQKLSKTIIDAYNISSIAGYINMEYRNYCNITVITRKFNRKIVNIDQLVEYGKIQFPHCTFTVVIFE